MASSGCSAFSADGQYWANCGNNGKLKIWETATSRLKQEYVPDSHLGSPCSAIGWITVGQQSISTTSLQWKKRKRKSIVDNAEQEHIVAMGSTNGNVTLYYLSSAKVGRILEHGHSSTVTALAWSALNGLFTVADDHQIVEWNIEASSVKCKWKSGKNKVTALAVLPDGKSILSANRIIKWWDLSTKMIIASFTGHTNQVALLQTVSVNSETSYLISGASGERYLSVWSLNEGSKDRNAIGTLTMQEDALSVSVKTVDDSQIVILTANWSGLAQLFKYQPNGMVSKPLQPSLNVVILSELQGSCQHIPIQAAQLTEDANLLLAYGTTSNLVFERVTPDFSDKVQCLVRADIKRTKEKANETLTKVKSVETDGNVEYRAPGSTPTALKRSRGSMTGSQLPLKERMDSLSLNTETSTAGRTPSKGANMTQLLMQGLSGKDKSVLMNVLCSEDETAIKNAVAKLPVQAITPLLRELTAMLQGNKILRCKIAVRWLKVVIATHAAHFASHPDIGDALRPILGITDAKIATMPELSRVRGRVSLTTAQISQSHEKDDKDIMEKCLLVYQDPDSSDEGSDVEAVAMESESDENWEEISEQGDDQKELENGRSDDDASICS